MTSSLLEKIGKEVKGDPILIQIACKGIWEEAWKINYHEGKPSSEEIQKYAEGKDEVAFEIFFKTHANQNVFFGLRSNYHLKNINDNSGFLEKAFQIIWSTNKGNFRSLISAISLKLTGKNNALLSGLPDILAIGVVDFWKSVGEFILWDKTNSMKISHQQLIDSFKRHPLLLQNDKNYIAMELAYQKNDLHPQHWLGIQVSKQEKNYHYLEKKDLLKTLTHLLDFEITD